MPTNAGAPERPIRSADDDLLERGQFIARLSAALVNSETNRATGIVIGLTGPWGSGKSSILNLLREHIKQTHKQAVVVSFDPWLVSGRNDLITEFLRQLLATIKEEPKIRKKLKRLTGLFTGYGKQLAPIANLVMPAVGTAAQAGLQAVESALSLDESLHGLRRRLLDELDDIDIPIVVLIDELDRIEDQEIRTVAQLVRSIADFPGISYLLAYDLQRVIQALGSDAPVGQQEDRGRSYLEKIVQLQIPLPITLDNEIGQLLYAELVAIANQVGIPENFQEIERYRTFTQIVIGTLVATPRDVKRLVGTYHAMGSMVRGEVDWLDLLAFCTLLTKAPRTIERIRSDPDVFVEDSVSARSIRALTDRQRRTAAERVEEIIPKDERSDAVAKLIGLLFPAYRDESHDRWESSPDSLRYRRTLFTALRLGIPPGLFSRPQILQLTRLPEPAVEAFFRDAYEKDNIAALLSRIEDIYPEFIDIDYISFWNGIAKFLRKSKKEWMRSYVSMHDITRELAKILIKSIHIDPKFGKMAKDVFYNLYKNDDMSLVPHIIRMHIHHFGLFETDKRETDLFFLQRGEVERLSLDLSDTWKRRHLVNDLLPWLWDLMPVYTMISTGRWDADCRASLDKALSEAKVLDGFTLMLFGGHYGAGRDTIASICDIDNYKKLILERQKSTSFKKAHETVRQAVNKSVGEY